MRLQGGQKISTAGFYVIRSCVSSNPAFSGAVHTTFALAKLASYITSVLGRTFFYPIVLRGPFPKARRCSLYKAESFFVSIGARHRAEEPLGSVPSPGEKATSREGQKHNTRLRFQISEVRKTLSFSSKCPYRVENYLLIPATLYSGSWLLEKARLKLGFNACLNNRRSCSIDKSGMQQGCGVH